MTQDAGRELDALVAEKVMGALWWRSSHTGRRALFMERPPEWFLERAAGDEERVGDWFTYGGFPAYSTDIAAAWQVQEKVGLFAARVQAGLDSGFTLQQNVSGEWEVRHRFGLAISRADTAPHAICLAALLAARAAIKNAEGR